MKRITRILLFLCLIGLAILMVLLLFKKVSLIANAKYLVVLLSGVLTFLSINTFQVKVSPSSLRQAFKYVILLFPFVFSLLAIVIPNVVGAYWNLFLGGSLFQIGLTFFYLFRYQANITSITALRLMTEFNYGISILLALIICIQPNWLTKASLLLVLGGYLSLSAILVAFLSRSRA